MPADGTIAARWPLEDSRHVRWQLSAQPTLFRRVQKRALRLVLLAPRGEVRVLEAVHMDLVSPSAWSAAPKIFSYPQADGRLPHLCPRAQTWRGHSGRSHEGQNL